MTAQLCLLLYSSAYDITVLLIAIEFRLLPYNFAYCHVILPMKTPHFYLLPCNSANDHTTLTIAI